MDGDKLRREDWTVVECGHAEAVRFIERIHYAGGAPNTSVARHALKMRDSSEIMGVALWLPPTKPAAASVADDHRTVLALSRLCVDPQTPKNAASFLLGASMRMIDRGRWPTLLTYADTSMGHTGAIYLATNWTRLGEVPGSDNWIDANGVRRGRKRAGRNLSASEMRDLGFKKLPPMPKIKFVHQVVA